LGIFIKWKKYFSGGRPTVTDSNNSDALNIGGEKAIGQAEKKTEAISGGEEMASECRLWRREERGRRNKVKKKPRRGDFSIFTLPML
jgi:hypothetical protein